MSNEIFVPMFYLILLTTGVYLFSTSIRLKEIYMNKSSRHAAVDGEEHRHLPLIKAAPF